MRRNLTLRALATLVVAGILIPSVGRAQTTVRVVSNPAVAQLLEDQATPFLSEPRRFGTAAELMLQAASIRSDTDPLGVSDMVVAAGALYDLGEQTKAREVYERAGDRALAMGDVARAARGYLWAAIIANGQHDPARDGLIQRATRLAASPLLTDAERSSILGQFKEQERVAEHH